MARTSPGLRKWPTRCSTRDWFKTSTEGSEVSKGRRPEPLCFLCFLMCKILSYDREKISEEPEGDDQGNAVFPADDRQDPAAFKRRVARGLFKQFRTAGHGRRRVHEFSTGSSSRSRRAGETRRHRRR